MVIIAGVTATGADSKEIQHALGRRAKSSGGGARGVVVSEILKCRTRKAVVLELAVT
jgi:hypothetical protein